MLKSYLINPYPFSILNAKLNRANDNLLLFQGTIDSNLLWLVLFSIRLLPLGSKWRFYKAQFIKSNNAYSSELRLGSKIVRNLFVVLPVGSYRRARYCNVKGASRMRAGQGIWTLRQGILGHFRPLWGIFGANGQFKDTFLFEGRGCIPLLPPSRCAPALLIFPEPICRISSLCVSIFIIWWDD